MCSPTDARSVAAMRLPLTICLTAASAAVLATSSPAFAADAFYGGPDGRGAPIFVKPAPPAKTMRSLVVSWRAACSDGTGFPGGGTLTPADPTPGFQPGPDELLIEKNAKGKFQGTQLMGSDLGTRVAAISVRISGALKPGKATGRLEATVKIVDKASGASAGSCQVGQRWSATRQPGVIFGGATSQDEPFIIRLNKQHTR